MFLLMVTKNGPGADTWAGGLRLREVCAILRFSLSLVALVISGGSGPLGCLQHSCGPLVVNWVGACLVQALSAIALGGDELPR
jgi:hypothetical protein